MKILVINPNSSASMSLAIEESIPDAYTQNESLVIDVYTAPPDSPSEINNEVQAEASSTVVLKDFSENPRLRSYDGYIVACFSDHPLVSKLPSILRENQKVYGIFHASLIKATADQSTGNCLILTSGKDWEEPLNHAILNFSKSNWPSNFEKTLSCGLSPLELENPSNYPQLKKIIQESHSKLNVSAFILGCAGLSSSLPLFSKDFPHLTFIDGTHSALELLSDCK